MASFKEKMERFQASLADLLKGNSIPKWFRPFVDEFQTFSKDLHNYILEEEGKLAVQKTVTEKLCADRDRLLQSVEDLEDELDEQQQYSRRNCLMVHGIQENPKENVEAKVMNVFDNKLQAGVNVAHKCPPD